MRVFLLCLLIVGCKNHAGVSDTLATVPCPNTPPGMECEQTAWGDQTRRIYQYEIEQGGYGEDYYLLGPASADLSQTEKIREEVSILVGRVGSEVSQQFDYVQYVSAVISSCPYYTGGKFATVDYRPRGVVIEMRVNETNTAGCSNSAVVTAAIIPELTPEQDGCYKGGRNTAKWAVYNIAKQNKNKDAVAWLDLYDKREAVWDVYENVDPLTMRAIRPGSPEDRIESVKVRFTKEQAEQLIRGRRINCDAYISPRGTVSTPPYRTKCPRSSVVVSSWVRVIDGTAGVTMDTGGKIIIDTTAE